jgi:hypothetical protein
MIGGELTPAAITDWVSTQHRCGPERATSRDL